MKEDLRQIKTIILNDEKKYLLPEEYDFADEVIYIDTESCHVPVKYESHLGTVKGLYYIWKSVEADYIFINCRDNITTIKGIQDEIIKGQADMILSRVYCCHSVQEAYRKSYFGYDIRLMMDVLKRDYKDYYGHACKNVLEEQELVQICGVIEKSFFDKFCAWMFPILSTCSQIIPNRKSQFQNLFCEHLANVLFTIYVTYWKEHHDIEYTSPISMCSEDEKQSQTIAPEMTSASTEDIISYLDSEIGKGQIEQASAYARRLPKERKELLEIVEAFENYEKERRYYKLTKLDTEADWKQLLRKKVNEPFAGIRRGKPRLLIFEWNSIGNNANVQAFRDFGFDCHTINAPFTIGSFREDTLEQLNRHLDLNQFDAVFSLNCIGIVAEACYVHDIPYIAWCYDAPTFTGTHWYLFYPTTHVFLFDSDDAMHYEMAKIPNTYYLPLATNLNYFGRIKATTEQRKKFSADISFVGSLYSSSLPEAMGHLTDYQKAYLNALMDNQIDIYGYNFFPRIISQKFVEWLDQEDFNQLINFAFEKDMEKSSVEVVTPGRLQLLLNRQTTNKERILLLNLLAKYYDVKLYSYTNNEALKNLTFCGTVDYYSEMPIVFRNSRINLNATLRSIQTGIPLRCLDIMGCHGLLLTNYQKDFDDHFVDEQNVLFYTDAQEALDKAKFYLEHESLREKIAEAGYATVKKYYDYPVKIKEMLEMSGLNYLIPKETI